MANLVDGSGDAGSNLVAGNGTESARFTMPGNVALQVESVLATITNGSTSDIRPELTVRDSSGVVIATKRQGAVIPAGDTGTATFALRLDDSEGLASSLSHPIGFYTVLPVGGNPVAGGAANPLLNMTFAGAGAGVDLLDTTVNGAPSAPIVKTSGMYAIIARLLFDNNPAGPFPLGTVGSADIFVQNQPPPEDSFSMETTQVFPMDNTFGTGALCTVGIVRYMKSDFTPIIGFESFQVQVYRPVGQSFTVTGEVQVQRIY